ncbi:F-box domain containing protein [Brugia malayi]|uniref:Bm10465, isoform e n=2 Tax=Brugia TaxID=6278 RepID=A0A1P6BGK7_BRUMA|nr:F-box domain containing protein [Brugia malayi]CDP98277.1 Bm10465, isoform e [Brugia malayi]VIO97799.1 F-box domain containing protein [Brugia malayi]
MDAITESPGRYRPVSRKYDTIDKRYKFFEATRAHRMQTYYPLIQLGRSSYSSTRHKTTNLKSQASTGSEVDINQFTADSDSAAVTINDLSNDILLTIFAYCHPIDLIHCFSLVCHRWNYLANHSAFFTEVRVLVNDISLKYGSVKKFFHRTSHYLRKLCIDCSVPLPSAEVYALFEICFPNVIHLDIGSFKEMNISLLKKLSYCFPNVEILHMDAVERCSAYDDECEEEWNEVLEMLFKNENIFPKMRNFFMGDVSQYCVKADEKLWACKRPLNLLRVNNGAIKLNFVGIGTSSWKSTLTELHLGYYIENEDFQYIADLHNLKVFSLGICIYVPDEFIAPLKNLYNLEELRINCGGEDCDLTNDGMIALFTLPCKHPEKSFPYKLKHLELADFHACRTNLLETINRNCPELRSLGLPYNKYMDDAAVPFIISHFKHLVHLNLSRLGDCYKNEDWNNLDDDDLPNLFFLKLHGNQVNIETFQSLNVKRPKLLISTKWNYLVNWTETDNGYIFHDTFDGDIRAIENDLRQIDGFCDIRITSPSFIYNRRHGSVARTSSFRSYPFAFKEKEPFEISIHDHSV